MCVSAVESVCAWEREKGKTNSVHGSWDLIYIISVFFFLLLNIFLFFFVILGIIYIYIYREREREGERERERESLASFMGTAFWGTLNAKQHVTLYRKQI